MRNLSWSASFCFFCLHAHITTVKLFYTLRLSREICRGLFHVIVLLSILCLVYYLLLGRLTGSTLCSMCVTRQEHVNITGRYLRVFISICRPPLLVMSGLLAETWCADPRLHERPCRLRQVGRVMALPGVMVEVFPLKKSRALKKAPSNHKLAAHVALLVLAAPLDRRRTSTPHIIKWRLLTYVNITDHHRPYSQVSTITSDQPGKLLGGGDPSYPHSKYEWQWSWLARVTISSD